MSVAHQVHFVCIISQPGSIRTLHCNEAPRLKFTLFHSRTWAASSALCRIQSNTENLPRAFIVELIRLNKCGAKRRRPLSEARCFCKTWWTAVVSVLALLAAVDYTFWIYFLISTVCPSRRHLSSHILTACIQPVLQQRQTAEPRQRVPFSSTAPPSCKRLCWQQLWWVWSIGLLTDWIPARAFYLSP